MRGAVNNQEDGVAMEGKSLIFKERWAEFDRVKGSLRTENRQ
jgi:hypothetical protein